MIHRARSNVLGCSVGTSPGNSRLTPEQVIILPISNFKNMHKSAKDTDMNDIRYR